MLTKNARQFRKDADHYQRNSHMHDLKEAPSQEIVDAVLTGFINHVGLQQGVDYAIYARDLKHEEKETPTDVSMKTEETEET